MIPHGLTLHYHVINVCLHIPAQLIFEHFGYHSLIGKSYILQPKWHDLVMKITSRGNEKKNFLVLRGQRYLVVSLESNKKTHLGMPIRHINKLVYLRRWKRIFRTCLFRSVKSTHTIHFPFFFFTTIVLAPFGIINLPNCPSFFKFIHFFPHCLSMYIQGSTRLLFLWWTPRVDIKSMTDKV